MRKRKFYLKGKLMSRRTPWRSQKYRGLILAYSSIYISIYLCLDPLIVQTTLLQVGISLVVGVEGS